MSKFYNNFLASYKAAGGWAGWATLQALEPLIHTYKDLGLTGKQCGVAVADHYRLHSDRATYRELAGFN